MQSYCIAIIIIVATIAPTYAQEFTYYTQYMFNGMAINPAYSGVHDFITLTGNIREQWIGMEGAPSTQTLSASMPVLNDQFGLGLLVIGDKVGVRSHQEVSINYAYKLRLPNFNIAMGLKVGFNTEKNNFNELFLEELNDADFQNNTSVFLPVVGFGAYLKARKYYVGLSVPQMHRFVSHIYEDFHIDQQRIIFLTGGYIFRLSEDFKMRPSILSKARLGGAFETDFNANFYYKDDYCFGLSYKSLNSLAILIEIGINKTYYIGYSYDVSTSKLIHYQSGTHEFSINVYLKKENNAKIINPRYF